MFNYFITPTSDTRYTIKKYYKFEYIKRRYQFEMTKVKEYYSNRDRAVDNRHILSRLVTLLAPNYNTETFEYFTIVDTNSKFLSKQFDIVSNLSKGKVLHNELYSGDSYEVLLYKESDINFDTIELTWKTESPLRCIKTSLTDVNFTFPYKSIKLPDNSLSIFELDINLMMMMYKFWSTDRISLDMSINPNVFIAKHVLPNSMDSIMDLTIVNRFFNILVGNKLKQDFVNVHPFTILDYTKGIDDILKDILKDVRGEQITIEQLFESIPSLSYDNMVDVTKLNVTYMNRQSKWVLWLAKSSMVRNILYLLGKKGRNRNKEYTTRILPFLLKAINNRDTELESILPKALYKNFNKDIASVKKLLK